MTDTSTVTTSTREAVADRQWIDAAGVEVDSPESATGFRYVDKASNKAFVWQTKLPAGEAATMLAIFGGLTKAGNIRNTLVNGPKGDPTADVIQGISDWFDELDSGTWSADRVGGGIRVNAEVLAAAIAAVKGESDPAKYLARITSKEKVKDPGDKQGKRDILYSTLAMRHPQVQAEYHKRLPAHSAAPSLGEL
jgi:hypothetical protein